MTTTQTLEANNPIAKPAVERLEERLCAAPFCVNSLADLERALDQADAEAVCSPALLSHEHVFAAARSKIDNYA